MPYRVRADGTAQEAWYDFKDLEISPDPSPSDRLSAGVQVKLAPGGRTGGSLGSPADNRRGVIVKDDGSDRIPYKVRADGSDSETW